MLRVSGGCHCGNVSVELELTRSPGSYSPRACDCDFCRRHDAAYVSDPKGALQIRVTEAAALGRYRQGSGQADMLFCRRCGVLIGPLYQAGGRRYAAINAHALDPAVPFGAATAVSPKQLAASDKAARWQNIWFAHVSISGATV